MQVIEILLINNPISVFAEYTEKYQPNDRVVVLMSGSIELGVVKGKVLWLT